MDLGESLVGAAWRWLRRRRRAAAVGLPVDADDRRLLAFAGLIAGRPVALRQAEALGGVRGDVVLLPARLGDARLDEAQAAELLLLRLALAAQAIADEHADDNRTGDDNDDGDGATAHAQRMHRAEASLCAAWPAAGARLRSLRAVFAALQPPAPLHWLFGAAVPANEAAALDALAQHQAEALRATLPSGTELQGRPRDAVTQVALPTEETPPLPVHVFEKVDTLDGFNGGRRKADGSDELQAHLDALDEVDLRAMLRGGRDVGSVLRVPLHGLELAPELASGDGGGGIPLDEWDYRAGSYRRGWVRVRSVRQGSGDAAAAATARRRLGTEVRELERRIATDRAQRRRLGRQPDGDDIDLDAWIEQRAAAAAGHGDFSRVESCERPAQRDVATLVLVDVSLSADAWVEDRRILDLTRDAAFVVGEVAHRLGDRLAVVGFASETRLHCRMIELVGFGEAWPQAAPRLFAVKPQGYTRIGPALRWGRRLLAATRARRQVLLLVTDGKPTDFDRYEGRYGIADVRCAVRECERDGVDVHALCLDRGAAATMPAMVGPGRFELLRHPRELPQRLASAWLRRGRSVQ